MILLALFDDYENDYSARSGKIKRTTSEVIDL